MPFRAPVPSLPFPPVPPICKQRLTRKAFNAFISTTVIVAQISFAIPAAILICRRRSASFLPPGRKFKLPTPIGYFSNAVTIIWAVVLLIFFCFPAEFPVTGGNMSMCLPSFPPLRLNPGWMDTNHGVIDYASPVLAIMLILGIANWFLYARKWYQGPRLEM